VRQGELELLRTAFVNAATWAETADGLSRDRPRGQSRLQVTTSGSAYVTGTPAPLICSRNGCAFQGQLPPAFGGERASDEVSRQRGDSGSRLSGHGTSWDQDNAISACGSGYVFRREAGDDIVLTIFLPGRD